MPELKMADTHATEDITTISKDLNEKLSLSPQKLRRGKCKWFNVQKGWGFITQQDGGPDVFVHQSVIKMDGFRSLGNDEAVLFDCKDGEKGLEATIVQAAQGAELKGARRIISTKKPRLFRKIRCYNCGSFGDHVANACEQGPLPKRCHKCKSDSHLIADCTEVNQTPEKLSLSQENEQNIEEPNN